MRPDWFVASVRCLGCVCVAFWLCFVLFSVDFSLLFVRTGLTRLLTGGSQVRFLVVAFKRLPLL